MKSKWKIMLPTLFCSIVSTTMTIGLFTQNKKASNEIFNYSQNANTSSRALMENDVTAKWKNPTPSNNNVDWWGKKKPDKADANEIKNLISFFVTKDGKEYETISANIVIELQKVETKHLSDGYIEFKVKQVKSNLGDQNTPSTIRYINAPNDSAGSSSDVWSTKKFNGLFISTKFNFEWRDQEEIAEFLKSTDKTVDSLTKEDVLLNFVKKGDGFELPDASKITLSKSAITNGEEMIEKQYGSTNISLSFSNVNATDWLGGKVPEAAKLKKEVRGLKSTTSNTTEMSLETKTTNEISNTQVDKTNNNIFNDYLLNSETNLKDLFPSEFSNLNTKNKNVLNDMFIKGEYLQVKQPLVQLKYFGMNVTDANFKSKTGIDPNTIGIKNIELVPDDINGIVRFKYEYNYFDVYMNQVSTEVAVKTLISQEEEFKKNPDANKILKFSWKDNDSLTNVPSINDILNQYNESKKLKVETNNDNNVDSKDKLKALSNQFFDATNDVYGKDREVEITKKGDSEIEMKLTFDSWSGEMYTEGSNLNEGFKTSKSFTISNSGLSGLTWKTDEDVKNSIENIETLSVEDVGNKLFNKELDINIFVSGIGSKNVLFDANPITGSLTITVLDGNNSSSRIFTGFKKETSNAINQFSWIPEEEIPQELLAIDLNVINEKDVIDKYLKNLNYFKNTNINENQVKLTKNLDSKSLLINVEVDKFNQDIASSSNKFSIELRGFIVTTIKNGNSYVAPKDLTILLSIIFAILVSSILIGILIWIVIKKFKLSKSNKIK